MPRQSTSRRDFLKTLGAGVLGSALAPGIAGAAKRRPNVLLIFTDDQGSMDLNCYGAKDLYTPNLDRLATQGTRFTQFYVGAPVCSPSRASLLTGRCPQRAGLATNSWGDRGLPPEQVTFAETFKAAGYHTGIIGKWHLGDTPRLAPRKQGFDEFFGHKVGCIDNYSHYFYWQGPNKHDLWRNEEEIWAEGSFFPDMVVSEASRFFEENKDREFFLYLPFNMPHYPLQGQAKFRERYKHLDAPRRMYCEFMSTCDEKIGQVIDKVDELGLRDNTIIVYLSDHGHSEEERTFGGGGYSGPYRGYKFNLWEGGIRVPCIVSWPGHIPENEVRDQLATSMDWFPTMAKYCGVPMPKHTIDGCDISAVIESADAKTPHEVFNWQFNKHWVVREGNWKLVYKGPSTEENGVKIPQAEYFLSDLSKDVTETKNIADRHPDVVRRLTAIHEKWAGEVGAEKL